MSQVNASIGLIQNERTIVAPGWQFITGTLGADGRRIDWSNGTYWMRCKIPKAPARSRLRLAGTWYADAIRSEVCSIRQHGSALELDNGHGVRASGSVDAQGRLTTDWSGNSIVGVVSPDGNRIDWDNGTWWVR